MDLTAIAAAIAVFAGAANAIGEALVVSKALDGMLAIQMLLNKFVLL